MEAMVQETRNPFYDVGRYPLVAEIDGENVEAGYDMLFNKDNNQAVGLITPNYNLVTNQEVADVFDQALSERGVFSVTDFLSGNGSSWVRRIVFDASDLTFDVTGSGDMVKAMVDIRNSYNGQSSVSINLSMWRLICKNGLMGWGRDSSVRLKHITSDLVRKIQELFSLNVGRFNAQTAVWKEWSEIPYGQDNFNDFIDAQIIPTEEAEDVTPTVLLPVLSPRQGTYIKESYEPTMNRYNEEETQWGAFNVLTAIASHDIKARKGSHVFTAAYDRMQRVVNNFYRQ